MQFEEIKSMVQENFPQAVLGENRESTPMTLILHRDYLYQVCDFLYTSDATYFDSLSCLTALDNGVEVNTMEVIYNLYSIPFDHYLMISVVLDRSKPSVDSVSDIWRTANWHEREAFDLMGIQFEGHPDLRRILLPDDWEGHPLLKDYEVQEKYHDIKVKY